MTIIKRLGLAVAIIGAMSGAAAAATVGYALKVSSGGALGGTLDAPGFTLTNLSDAGLTISSIHFTIGDTTRNFDSVTSLVAPAGGTISLTTGDTANNGARTDDFMIAFTGFDATEVATWRTEIDPDSSNAALDFRTVFFNNGGPSIPNSVATVLFSDSRSIQLTLAGSPGQTSYTFAGLLEDVVVPLPAALPLMLGAFGMLGLTRLRSRKA